ncbi:YihY/virulence factor BrkB family protein [Micrococcus sp. FDAARGOS_333]|uniref:YihY/virulence factor BrkB family protein n=1 Tax=Micrococcus sp. FDAARGOS_333 TaxID=1930558 RepID=UPI001D11CB91|nr:YihY/virulence factor BrkB family protein [Micrococcus sp. FDAARGOS_333]
MTGSQRRSRRVRPRRTYQRPRVSLLYVLRRTGYKLLEIQVWDVAAAMTFFAALALLPTMVALVSTVSLLGLQDETIATAAGLITEIWPALSVGAVESTILALGGQATGTTTVVLGTLGALFSASGAVGAFHRAMHRIHDTREGRRFPAFRLAVFVETLALTAGTVVVLLLVVLGGDLSARIGRKVGLTQEAVDLWNLAKWPVILAIIMVVVSAAYQLGPNVRQPRYRAFSHGAVASVLLLFGATALLGWVTANLSQTQLVGWITSAIGILMLAWVTVIVLLAGAAFDAEMLRARQLAVGLDAADEIQLASRHTAVLKDLEQMEQRQQRVGRIVSKSARTGVPAVVPRTRLLTESGSLFAVEPRAGRTAADLSTGRPFHAQLDPDDVPDPETPSSAPAGPPSSAPAGPPSSDPAGTPSSDSASGEADRPRRP